MLWGSEDHLQRLFGDDVASTHRQRTFTFRFPSAEAFVDTFARFYGPTRNAIEIAGPPLERDLTALVAAWSRLPQPGPVAAPGAYLESIGARR